MTKNYKLRAELFGPSTVLMLGNVLDFAIHILALNKYQLPFFLSFAACKNVKLLSINW